MTPKDIAIFKHFIVNKDLRKIFINAYNRSIKTAELPNKIEDYLNEVDAIAVIIKAVRVVSPNSVFGFDFWQNLNHSWKIYYEKMQSSNFIQYDDGRLMKLEGYYSILRENWDDPKPWRFDPVDTALVRLGLKDPEELTEEEPAEEPAEETEEVHTAPQEDNTQNDDELTFLDIRKNNSGGYNGRRMEGDEASINFRNKSYRMTFSQPLSSTISANDFTHASLATNRHGDVIIRFSYSGTTRLTLRNNRTSVAANSKEFCLAIRKLLNATNMDFVRVSLTEIDYSSSYIDYKVKLYEN